MTTSVSRCHLLIPSILSLLLLVTTRTATGFNAPPPAAPLLGIGAILFRPRGTTIRPSEGDKQVLADAGKFFVDAFWTNKVGGGAKTLSVSQTMSLTRQQVREFDRRYGLRLGSADRRAELLICTNSDDDVMGCVGIEVDTIRRPAASDDDQSLGRQVAVGRRSPSFAAPLMSNLAVGRRWRRKGLAEDLVAKAEELARKQWGYDECYLYVEKQNVAAVKLYKKLGYRVVWEDGDAKTLLPTEGGQLINADTVIVCMKKRLGAGVLGRFLPF